MKVECNLSSNGDRWHCLGLGKQEVVLDGC